MKKMINLLAVTTTLAVGWADQAPPPPSPPEDFSNIQNFLRINEQFCTGGQPSMENLEKMKAEGVRSIINLRQASEYNFAEEAATAKTLDLRYFHIPVDKNNLKDEQAEEFLKITDDPQNRPIFVHCATAGRVGAFWMIRRVLVDNWKTDEAEVEARKVGLHDEKLRDWALDYIKRHSQAVEKK